jgi:GntR family transcriptional regulator/MocR family aminotransferase
VPRPAYDLRVGTPDLAAFPRRAWLAAVRQVMAELPHEALGYADPGGVPELRAELAAYLGRVRAAAVPAGRLVVVNGVAQGLHLTIRALARNGPVPLAVEDPHSVGTYELLEAAGGVRVPVPVDGEGIDVGALRRSPARAVLVTPAHQYPTGVVLSPRRRAELIAWAEEVDGFVLEDDYDAEFRYDRDPVGCLQGLSPRRVVLLGSVSKSLAPGLRLGWLVAPPSLAGTLGRARALSDLGSPVIDQHALARLIAGGAYDRHLRQLRRRYRARRDALAGALARRLPGAVAHGVPAGIQLYLELPAGLDEAAVVRAAAERGLAVEGVAPLRVEHAGPPALVLGFARLPERRLTEAVRLLAEAVAACAA